MANPSATAYESLPFAEQQTLCQRKLNLPTTIWTEIYTQQHDWAVVAGDANRAAIVAEAAARVGGAHG